MYTAGLVAIRLEALRFDMVATSDTMLDSILAERGIVQITVDGAKRVDVAVNEDSMEMRERILHQGRVRERPEASQMFAVSLQVPGAVSP